MSALSLPLLIVEIGLLLPGLYLLFLTLCGLFYRSTHTPGLIPISRFAILIPAHNEEHLLPRLLENMASLEYPKEMFDVYVVADNCSDATADVTRSHGAIAFQRKDLVHQGKGHALRWLLERVRAREKEYDVYLFLDADSLVSRNFLAVMDAKFQSGSSVVQSYYTVSNATQTPVSTLRFIALTLMHYVRPKGRKVLGLSCGLFGTGMGFKKEVLDSYGWDSFTLAEDVEYYLKLTDRGVKVDFVPEAILWAQMPVSFKDARSQNLRWERGRLQMARRYGLRFLMEGIFKGNLRKLDAAIEQLIPPLSITFTVALVLLLLSILTGNIWLIAIGAVTNAALLGHLFIGLLSARAPLRVYMSFAYAPWFILWKLSVYLQALMPGKVRWTRTQRS